MAEPAQLRPFGLLSDVNADDFDEAPDEAPAVSPVGSVGGDSPEDAKKGREPRTGPRPRYPLPTERMVFSKQIALLRSFAVASGGERKPVTLAEVATLVPLATNTASLVTPFFVDIGLLTRSEGKKFTPTEVTLEFNRESGWRSATAGECLAPALRRTWFAQALEKRLMIQGTISVDDAVMRLASDAAASHVYQTQIRLLLDYLVLARLIERNGDTLRLPSNTDAAKPGEEAGPAPMPPAVDPVQQPVTQTETPRVASTIDTVKPSGAVQLNVSINIDMAELSTWSPDRIAAFFSGLARVMAAKEDKLSN